MKGDIIDFKEEEERVGSSKKIEKVEKNLDSDSDCGVDVFFNYEKESLLAAPTSDTQKCNNKSMRIIAQNTPDLL
jgi:hypothetical protein